MPKKEKTLLTVAESRTDLWFLKPSDCAPSTIVIDDKSSRLNVREDFGDLKLLREFISESIEHVGPKKAVPGVVTGHFDKASGKFLFTDGERRWRAANDLERSGIEVYLPCRAEPHGYTDEQRVLDVLITQNGKKLTMSEQARAIQRVMAMKAKEIEGNGASPAKKEKLLAAAKKEIAKRSGCSLTHVDNCLLLLSLPEPMREAVENGTMSATLAIDIQQAAAGEPEKALEIFGQARVNAEKSGSDHVTAKHVPVATGKARQAEKAADAAQQTVRQVVNVASSPAPAPAIDNQNSIAEEKTGRDGRIEGETAQTNDHGEFINGIKTVPLKFPPPAQKIRAKVHLAERNGKWFSAIFLAVPRATAKGEPIANQRVSTKTQAFPSEPAALLGGLQSIRAEIELLAPGEFKFAPAALAHMDELMELAAPKADQTGRKHEPAAPSPTATVSIGNPVLKDEDKEPAVRLVEIHKAIAPSIAVKERYQTVGKVIAFLKGKLSGPDLTKFICDI